MTIHKKERKENHQFLTDFYRISANKDKKLKQELLKQAEENYEKLPVLNPEIAWIYLLNEKTSFRGQGLSFIFLTFTKYLAYRDYGLFS